MKIAPVLFLLLCLCSAQYRTTKSHQRFIQSVNAYNQLILPEYRDYVKKDSCLSVDHKSLRLSVVRSYEAHVRKALQDSSLFSNKE